MTEGSRVPNGAAARATGSPIAAHDEHAFDPASQCVRCRTRIPFEFPAKLIDEALNGQVVVFAGAGISTENSLVFPYTFYDEIVHALSLGPEATLTFPEAMDHFERQHGRPELVQRIRRRLDYVDAFPQLRSSATEFHRELSTLFPITEIVTTNWDTYFESDCGAIPIVTPDDYGFWNLPGRKVFKIHGSISNVGSLVATAGDYEECYESLRTGLIGSSLKHMLATKTIIFFGYSFRDPDFNTIYELLRAELGRMIPRAFIVTLDPDFDASRFEGASIVYTGGAYFLERFKAELSKTHHFLPDERFEGVFDLLDEVLEEHSSFLDEFPLNEYPTALYVAAYQDGLIDALERIIARRHTGEYSHVCDLKSKLRSYDDMTRRFRRERRYDDVAYAEGYSNGLLYLILPDSDREHIPFGHFFGVKDSVERDDLREILAQGPSLHRAAYARAERMTRDLPDGFVLDHTPFLG